MAMRDDIQVGGLVKFRGERNPYRVQARSERFVICTKPFAPQKTVLYTIIDFERHVRGPDNMVFGNGYETREDCEARLAELVQGEIEVSYRRNVALAIEAVKLPRIDHRAAAAIGESEK